MLTEDAIVDINERHYNIALRNFDADIAIARAIEHAATAPLLEEIERIKNRCAELEKDAGRYRWLRSVPDGFKAMSIVNDTPKGMDSAIDSAMSIQKKA